MSRRRVLYLLLLTAVTLVVALPGAALGEGGGPQAFVVTPPDGWAYPQGAKVQFAFYCTSDMSALVSCAGSQPLGSFVDTATAGPHTLSVTATDYDGRQATATTTYTVIDTTPPHIEFHTPTNGATYDLGTYLTYDFSCVDDPGGLGIAGCPASRPFGTPIDTSRMGTFTFEVWAFDLAGNYDHQTITYTVADRTPPSITLSSPADGAAYTLGQPVWVSFFCDDGWGGSGMYDCSGDLPDGTQLDTSSVGPRTFTVTAHDRAENVAKVTHTYSVIYDFAGFDPPASEYPTATPMKAGEGIPLKFSLHGDQGVDVFAAGSPGWAPCGALDGPTPADGSLSYNGSNDRYTYLAATSKAWAGSCRDLIVTLRDGTVQRARFRFSK